PGLHVHRRRQGNRGHLADAGARGGVLRAARGGVRKAFTLDSPPRTVMLNGMALQDHFHPPLSLRRHWHAFHNAWATYLSSDLNRQLPEGYFAEPNVQFGI